MTNIKKLKSLSKEKINNYIFASYFIIAILYNIILALSTTLDQIYNRGSMAMIGISAIFFALLISINSKDKAYAKSDIFFAASILTPVVLTAFVLPHKNIMQTLYFTSLITSPLIVIISKLYANKIKEYTYQNKFQKS